jgi:hypothetical protein
MRRSSPVPPFARNSCGNYTKSKGKLAGLPSLGAFYPDFQVSSSFPFGEEEKHFHRNTLSCLAFHNGMIAPIRKFKHVALERSFVR